MSRLSELPRDERLLLMRFVCSFAWADQRVDPEERKLVARFVRRLELEPDEARQVDAWLATPHGLYLPGFCVGRFDDTGASRRSRTRGEESHQDSYRGPRPPARLYTTAHRDGC